MTCDDCWNTKHYKCRGCECSVCAEIKAKRDGSDDKPVVRREPVKRAKAPKPVPVAKTPIYTPRKASRVRPTVRPFTAEMVRELLDATIGCDVPQILEETSQRFQLSIEVLLGPIRRDYEVRVRQACMLAMQRNAAMTLPAIGRVFNRDRTTVHYSCNKMARCVENTQLVPRWQHYAPVVLQMHDDGASLEEIHKATNVQRPKVKWIIAHPDQAVAKEPEAPPVP